MFLRPALVSAQLPLSVRFGANRIMTEPTQDAPAGPADPSQESAAQPASLETRLADAEARIQEQHDAWLRAVADAENARKRAQADISNARKFAVESIAESLLPVLDSLEAALASDHTDPATLQSGVELTLRQLKSAFERAHIAEINPPAAEKFNPHHHQAMASVESSTEPPNTIVSVMQKGYTLHERVIRPALVTVAKAKA